MVTRPLPGQLSEQGRSLAVELGRRRRDDGLAAVFVSDLTRAVDTAHLAFGGTGIPIHQDPRLRECDYGQLNGMPTALLQAERLQHLDTPWPGGQSYQQVVVQTRDLLRELTAEWDGTRLLVIAHSANRWALDHLLNGRELADLVGRESYPLPPRRPGRVLSTPATRASTPLEAPCLTRSRPAVHPS